MSTTWNPSDKDAGVVLSNTNHTATVASGPSGVRATSSHNAGKWYLEFPSNTFTNSTNLLGFADASQVLNAGPSTSHTIGLGNSTGSNLSGSTLSMASSASGHNAQMAIDIGAGKIWFRLDGGAWNPGVSGTQNPATGAGGMNYTGNIAAGVAIFPYFYAVVFSGGSNLSTINAGDTAFANAAPSGFTAWDSTPPPPPVAQTKVIA